MNSSEQIEIKYIVPSAQTQKYELMKFLYDNTEEFVMNTFGYLWESRQWWDKFPIMIATQCNTERIIGLHAFTLNTKAPDTLKTYYIAVKKSHRGKGIAKRMTLQALNDSVLFCSKFYVNSTEASDGCKLYSSLFKNGYKESPNEFGLIDYEFCDDIKNFI